MIFNLFNQRVNFDLPSRRSIENYLKCYRVILKSILLLEIHRGIVT